MKRQLKYCRIFFGFTLLILGLVLLLSCAGSYTPTAVVMPGSIPTLDCAGLSLPQKTGWQWNGITVGISTKDDIIKQLQPGSFRVISPCLERYFSDDSLLHIVLLHGIVDQLSIGLSSSIPDKPEIIERLAAGLPHTLQDAKFLYGEPDIIGFGSDEMFRVLVWERKSVMVLVGLDYRYPLEQAKIFEITFLSQRAVTDISTLGIISSESFPRLVLEARNPFDQWEKLFLEKGK